MIKLFSLILIFTSSISFANERPRGYLALEQKDYKIAPYYLSYDANLGDDKAQYNLGIMYKKGLGINKNYKLTLKSFKFSALSEHPKSRLMLGNMYYHGQGVAVSYPKAFLWWRLAEDLNIGGARQNINMIKKKMTREQYILGDKLYSDCMQDTLYNCTKNFGEFN